MSSSPVRLLHSSGTPASPPAVWAAFARQGAWKNWVMAGQFVVIFALVVACIGFARKPPDIVLVDPNGKSTYLNESIAGDALLRFVNEQKQLPSDVTVVHFTQEFLDTFLGVNSSTVEFAWPRALSMMTPDLRARMSKEAAANKLVESIKLAQVRTELHVEKLDLVERFDKAMHVRAVISRKKLGLTDGRELSTDRLVVDVIEIVVPRTAATPDGLQLAEYRNTVENPSSTPAAPEASPNAH